MSDCLYHVLVRLWRRLRHARRQRRQLKLDNARLTQERDEARQEADLERADNQRLRDQLENRLCERCREPWTGW
jgi:hypothetical protein